VRPGTAPARRRGSPSFVEIQSCDSSLPPKRSRTHGSPSTFSPVAATTGFW
jgi:hypothetical protein